MAGYKKNTNVNENLAIAEFDNYSSALNDNVEDKLYSKASNIWFAYCISGYTVKSATQISTFVNLNPPEVVDLGDGIARYKVKIQIISLPNISSPSLLYSSPFGSNLQEHTRQFNINFKFDIAYTENLSQLPIYGSTLLIEEYGNTKFIKQQISRTAEEYKSTVASSTTKDQWSKGIGTNNIPDDYIFPKRPRPPCTKEYKQQNIVLLEQMMTKHQITDQYARVAIIGVIMKESSLCPKSESGHYTAGRLAEVFSTFSTTGRRAPKGQGKNFANEKANEYARNPVKLFNFTYEQNRSGKRKLGNRAGTNDGYNFRGRGFNQITFRGSYAKYSKLMGVDFLSDPEKMNEPRYAAEAAILFFKGRFASKHARGKPPFKNQAEANIYCAWANTGWGKTRKEAQRAIDNTARKGTNKLNVVGGKIILKK